MGNQRTYKPRHLRAGAAKSFRSINLNRDRDQRLHKTAEWVRFSKRFLKVNDECYCCGERSEAVDHIEPSKGRLDVFERFGNHLPLCHSCHNTITGKFDRSSVDDSTVEKKLKWIAETRAANEIKKSRKFKSVKVLEYKNGS